MANRIEYDFPAHVTGTTFAGVDFTIDINTVPLDLTGASIEMIIGLSDLNVQPLFTTANGALEITDPTGGVFQFKEQLIDLPEGDYRYEFIITWPSGKVKSYIYGVWCIQPGVVF